MFPPSIIVSRCRQYTVPGSASAVSIPIPHHEYLSAFGSPTLPCPSNRCHSSVVASWVVAHSWWVVADNGLLLVPPQLA